MFEYGIFLLCIPSIIIVFNYIFLNTCIIWFFTNQQILNINFNIRILIGVHVQVNVFGGIHVLSIITTFSYS